MFGAGIHRLFQDLSEHPANFGELMIGCLSLIILGR